MILHRRKRFKMFRSTKGIMLGLLFAILVSISSAESKCKDGTYPSTFIDGCLSCPTDLKDCDGQPPYEKRTCKVRCRLNEEKPKTKPKTNPTTTLPTEQQTNYPKRFHSEKRDKLLLTTKASSPPQLQPSQDDTAARSRDSTQRKRKDKLLVLIMAPIIVLFAFGLLVFDCIRRRGTFRKPLCAGYILYVSQQELNAQPDTSGV